MDYVNLRENIRISRITFGCWELGGGQWEKQSDDVNLQVIEQALILGINSFDTAEGYGNGHSESILGEALAKHPRETLVIATKVSPNHLYGAEVRRAIEQSLTRLRTDYVDVYYIHWPNPDIPLTETMAELRRLKEEGLIRSIGLSNFSLAQMHEAMAEAPVEVIQPEYSLLSRSIESDIVPYCIAHGIAILTYSSIAKGILTGTYHQGQTALPASDFRSKRRLFLPEHIQAETPLVNAIQTIAERRRVSMAQVAIAWLLAQPGMSSAIIGTQNSAHLKDNVKALDWQLSAEELSSLDDVSRDVLTHIDAQV